MKAAQIAIAVLAGVLIVSGMILMLDGQQLSGWILSGFGLLGFLSLLSMVATDRR